MTAPQSLTYRDALLESMRTLMRDNPDAIVLGQGADDFKGIFGTTVGLPETFGAERVMDTPLAEEAVCGIAIGAALNGMYPILTHIRADFMLLATNQIVNLAAKYRYMFGGRFRVPMLIRTVVGRSWGQGAQHSQSLQSLFAHIPGLVVLMPSSPQAILDAYPAAARLGCPVISFEHRLLYDVAFLPEAPAANPLSSRRIRAGKDVTVVATSIMVLEAKRVAAHLANFGIDCDVIDLNVLTSPDWDMVLESVRRTGRLLIADTSWLPYGVASEVCRIVCERAHAALSAPVVCLGMAPSPCPTAKALEDIFYPNLHDFGDAIARLVTGRTDHGIPLPDETSMADVYKKFKGPF